MELAPTFTAGLKIRHHEDFLLIANLFNPCVGAGGLLDAVVAEHHL